MNDGLATLSLRRPVLASVLSIVIVLFGLISYRNLGVREYPVVEPPVITVVTTYSGANAEVVEREITDPIENEVNSVSGIRTLTSVSQEGRSEIRAEFSVGVDLEVAANDVRDRVSRAVENLPDDANPPSVRKEDPNSAPIIFFNLTSDVRDRRELTRIVRNTFREQLRTVEGVSIVSTWGQQRDAIRLWMDPDRMTAHDLTASDVRRAVSLDHAEMPSGIIEGAEAELTISTMGRMATAEEFDNLILRAEGGTLVRFRDIGHAEMTSRDDRTVLARDGRAMIGVAVVAQPGANQIDLADEVHRRIEQISRNLPDDVQVLAGYDTTEFIRASIADVQVTLVIAFLLVIAIIFLFLRNLRATLVPVIVVPITVVGSFFVMASAGFTINILTMLALILAIGLVVDDAIIVLENIYAKLEQGLSPMEAGARGTREIFFAIVATSLALISVFTPILFMEGMTGQLFREFGVVMMGAVAISSFVALTLTPMLSTRVLRANEEPSRFHQRTEPFFRRLTERYDGALRGFLARPQRALWILGGSVLLIVLLFRVTPEEVAPLEDRSTLNVTARAPEGATFHYMDGIMQRVATIIEEAVPEAAVVNTVTSRRVTNEGEAFITLVPPRQRARGQDVIARELASALQAVPGAQISVRQPPTLAADGSGMPVQFVVQSTEPGALSTLTPSFLESVRAHPAFSYAEVDLSFDRPELQVNIDRNRARTMGVSVLDVAETLQLSYSGSRFGYFTMEGEQQWVQGMLADEHRGTPDDLMNLTVRSSGGDLIRLDNLVELHERSGPPALYRFNRLASATFSADLSPGYSLGDGVAAMQALAAEHLDEGVYTDMAGSSRDFVEGAASLNFIFLLALVFIYLVLAGQFESFRDPLIIILTVPLALVGALFAIWYLGATLNVFSKIGMIMLVGLVTKNGILIVEFANQRRKEGLDPTRAVADASIARFRPILMTSCSTILGVLPLTFAVGAGAESRSSMGIAVIGGLMVGTFLSLFVVPAMYALLTSRLEGKLGSPVPHLPTVLLLASITWMSATPLAAREPDLAVTGSRGEAAAPRNDILTLEEALRLGMERNHGIRLARNQHEADRLGVSVANAAFLPRIWVSGSRWADRQNVTTDQDGMQEIGLDGLHQWTASVELEWTVFDGLRMFATRGRLAELERLGETEARMAVERTARDIIVSYYAITRENRLLTALQDAVAFSQERLRIAQTMRELGSGSEYELLLARRDLNTDRAASMRQEAVVDDARLALIRLLDLDVSTQLEVEPEIELLDALDQSAVLAGFATENRELEAGRIRVEAARHEHSEVRREALPVVSLVGGYGVTRDDLRFATPWSQEVREFRIGVNVQLTLFDGLARRRRSQVAGIEAENRRIELAETQRTMEAGLQSELMRYTNARDLLALEEENLALASEAMRIALEQFRLATITSTELRETQRIVLDTEARLIDARYDAKIAETELLRLSGGMETYLNP